MKSKEENLTDDYALSLSARKKIEKMIKGAYRHSVLLRIQKMAEEERFPSLALPPVGAVQYVLNALRPGDEVFLCGGKKLTLL